MTTLAFPIPRPTHPTGLWNWITTIDHKKIGVLYGVTAFILFLSGGIEALLMRIQLAGPGQDIVSAEIFNQLFTMHGTTMIFLAIMPLSAAFFNFVIPLQIGARDVAFPRLNAFSYWTFLAGAIILKISWFTGGATNAGWFGYAPLTSVQQNPGTGIDYWIVSLQVLGIASLAASFNFLVTIINMRAPGMSFMRLPLFTWMTFITNILIVLAFPVITVALIELYFDRSFGMNFFNVAQGRRPGTLAAPLLGVRTSGGVHSHSARDGHRLGNTAYLLQEAAVRLPGDRARGRNHRVHGLDGVEPSHVHGRPRSDGPVAVFTITTMAIAVPTGIKVFNWMGTMWGGAMDFKTPMLYAIGFVAMFTIGGMSGVMHSMASSDAQQQDTYFIVAHIHYVLFGGAIFAIFAGIFYWFPKITGRMYNETLGKINFWVTFVGFNIAFFPQHFLGLDGMPRRIYTYDVLNGLGLLERRVHLWRD